jgi:tol-pal system protein YbgF
VRQLLLFIVTVIMLTACAGGDRMVQRQTSMEGRIEQVMQAHNETLGQIAEDKLSRQTASEKGAETERQLLIEKLSVIAKRIERLEADIPVQKAARIELVNRESAPATREEQAQAAYMRAFGLFSANNYRAAAEAFDAFTVNYPDSEYTANARYWLGECYFSEGRFKQAIDAFARVIAANPPAKRAPDALQRSGLSWYSLNEPEKGREALRTLIEKYPGSDAAARAKEQLDRQ